MMILYLSDKGAIKPEIVRKRVVLPIPDEPIIAILSPWYIFKLTDSTNGLEYPIDKFSNVIIGSSLECSVGIVVTPSP